MKCNGLVLRRNITWPTYTVHQSLCYDLLSTNITYLVSVVHMVVEKKSSDVKQFCALVPHLRLSLIRQLGQHGWIFLVPNLFSLKLYLHIVLWKLVSFSYVKYYANTDSSTIQHGLFFSAYHVHYAIELELDSTNKKHNTLILRRIHPKSICWFIPCVGVPDVSLFESRRHLFCLFRICRQIKSEEHRQWTSTSRGLPGRENVKINNIRFTLERIGEHNHW